VWGEKHFEKPLEYDVFSQLPQGREVGRTVMIDVGQLASWLERAALVDILHA